MINFGALPDEFSNEENSRIVILPVPYDGTSTWIKGADNGPRAILEASANMELYDIETNSEVYLEGIFTADPVTEKSSPEKMVETVFNRVTEYLNKGKYPVVIGGEHSVSIGSIQAFAQKYPDLSVLQLDAHSDLREKYEGSPNNHACVMARAKEVASMVQVGIRAIDSGELASIDPERIFYAHRIHNNNEWMEKATDKLSDRVYITVDLDAFDPSIMPSTGTPVPGGMRWYQALTFLEMVISRKKVVGFDIVELCPTPDTKAPDFLAAKLIYSMLSMVFIKQNMINN